MLVTHAGRIDVGHIQDLPTDAAARPAGLTIEKVLRWVAATAWATGAALVVMPEPPPDARYLAAEAFARTSPAVVAQVGEVFKIRKQLTIAAQLATLTTGDSLYQFRLCGDKGSAQVAVRAGGEHTSYAYRFALDGVERF